MVNTYTSIDAACAKGLTDFKAKTASSAAYASLVYMHSACIKAISTKVGIAQLRLWLDVYTIL